MKKLFTIGASTIPGEFIIPCLLREISNRLPDMELKDDEGFLHHHSKRNKAVAGCRKDNGCS